MNTKQTAFAALMAVGIQASWQDLMIHVDGSPMNKKIQSQEWSSIPDDGDDYCAAVPNNNSFGIKNQESDGAGAYFMPYLRGGAMEYTVDLSSVDCGCVAGVYAVAVNDQCNPEDPFNTSARCDSIDIMQANPYGFNTAAHPCSSGACTAASQCEYNMKVQGKEKYGDDAYGPGGDMIDTDMKFNVKMEFISTANYYDLWKLRTRITQGNEEIMLEADCGEYLAQLNQSIEGNMGYVFSTWDNRDGDGADFECEGACPEPASSCDNAVNAIRDIKFYQWGYNWDPEDEESEEESEDESEDESEEESEEESEDEEPVDFESFTGNIDDYGEWDFHVKGLQGSQLHTDGDAIYMYENNKAFVLDYPFDESVYWSYWHPYLGGSVQFDVNVSEVGCGCAAGVYLARLNDEECSWDAYEAGTTPQCGTVDLMEANEAGFKVQSQPCFDGTCDQESQCKRSAAEVDSKAFGPGPSFEINTMETFTVKTMFETSVDENGEYTDLVTIKTCLMQDGRQVDIEQDCGDYLDPLTWQLDSMMALGISVFEVGVHNEISDTCTSQCSAPKAAISNFQWNKDDSIEDPRGPIVTGELSNSLSDCTEDGCTECRDGWYEFVPADVFPVCTDFTVYKYGNACSNVGKFSSGTCNPGDDFCMKSYPWGDPDRHRSDHAQCRVAPAGMNEGECEYSTKACRTPTSGLCAMGCDDGQECRNSWPVDSEFKWKDPAATCRCMDLTE